MSGSDQGQNDPEGNKKKKIQIWRHKRWGWSSSVRDERKIGGEHLWNAKGRMGERRGKTKVWMD